MEANWDWDSGGVFVEATDGRLDCSKKAVNDNEDEEVENDEVDDDETV